MRELRNACLLVITLGSLACATAPKPAVTATATRAIAYTLQVALYPVPDVNGDGFDALRTRIQNEFQVAYPQYRANVVFNAGDYYDQTSLQNWLTQVPGAGGYDIVEFDTIFLGNIVTAAAPPEWHFPPLSNWFPAGLAASKVNGTLYGIPHLLCGYFVFSATPAVTAATTAAQLTTALNNAPPHDFKMNINLLGSNTTGALYLDVFSMQNGPAGVQNAMTARPLNAATIANMQGLSTACRFNGTNPCYDGTYRDGAALVNSYTHDRTVAAIAYSEVLHDLIPAAPRMAPAPLGSGKPPLLFTDSLVMNHRCDATCQDAASSFATYLTSSTTFQWFLLGQDTHTAIPRYLMPSTQSAYTTAVMQNNYYSGPILAASRAGVAFPNTGFIEARASLKKDVMAAIQP
jgi:thiamine pyridinylase